MNFLCGTQVWCFIYGTQKFSDQLVEYLMILQTSTEYTIQISKLPICLNDSSIYREILQDSISKNNFTPNLVLVGRNIMKNVGTISEWLTQPILEQRSLGLTIIRFTSMWNVLLTRDMEGPDTRPLWWGSPSLPTCGDFPPQLFLHCQNASCKHPRRGTWKARKLCIRLNPIIQKMSEVFIFRLYLCLSSI